MKHINVNMIEDDSVNLKLEKVAKKLNTKYTKKRKVNEMGLLRTKSTLEKCLSGFLSAFLTILISICLVLSCSVLYSRVSKVAPSFLNFSLVRISSGSMVNSGFNVGDKAVIKYVNAESLKPGDKIAFYVYEASYSQFNQETTQEVSSFAKRKTEFNFAKILGLPTKEYKQAANAGSQIVFHQISKVFVDQNGERWFQTRGTSNASDDVWKTNQNYVLGVYDNSQVAKNISGLLSGFETNQMLIMLSIIPFVLILIWIIAEILKQAQIVKLSLDCVEEKRKITDEICVKNDIGFTLNRKDKIKVLAQANQHEKIDYMHLLWKRGQIPNGVRKYLIKKELYLKPVSKLCNLNRECEKMLKDGVSKEKIAKHYLQEKEKIRKEQILLEKKMKKLTKKYAKG